MPNANPQRRPTLHNFAGVPNPRFYLKCPTRHAPVCLECPAPESANVPNPTFPTAQFSWTPQPHSLPGVPRHTSSIFPTLHLGTPGTLWHFRKTLGVAKQGDAEIAHFRDSGLGTPVGLGTPGRLWLGTRGVRRVSGVGHSRQTVGLGSPGRLWLGTRGVRRVSGVAPYVPT